MFLRIKNNICLNFVAALIGFFLASPSIYSEAEAASSTEFAAKIFKAGKHFNCRARGWFTGYSGETDISFYGSYITVMPSPWRYDEKNKELYYTIDEVYHIIKVIRRGEFQIIGQLYRPGLEGLGVDPLTGTVELGVPRFR